MIFKPTPPDDHRGPGRLSRIVRSGAVFWTGFGLTVVLVAGLMTQFV